jgi:hypothetical protein
LPGAVTQRWIGRLDALDLTNPRTASPVVALLRIDIDQAARLHRPRSTAWDLKAYELFRFARELDRITSETSALEEMLRRAGQR